MNAIAAERPPVPAPVPAAGASALSRIAHIDGLRALAVLSVLFYHASHYSTAAHAMLEGRHGVDLFFVISGFCLSYPALRAIATRGSATFDVTEFFTKRVLRIVPPYWIAVAACALLSVFLVAHAFALPDTIQAFTATDIAKQAFFLDYNLNFSNGSFWTLAVECRWYLAFPLILLLWVRNRRAFWLVAIASFVAYHFTRLHVIDFATLPAFMGGIVAADLCIRRDPRAWLALPVLPCAVVAAYFADSAPGSVNAILQDAVLWQIVAFCLVVASSHYAWMRGVFAWRPLAFVGLASYSIYLYHEPIAGALTLDYHWNWIGAALASLAIGVVAWWLFERQTQEHEFRERFAHVVRARLGRVMRFLGVSPAISL